MKKILIIEDDPMLGEIYAKKFTAGEYNVTIAINGAEAFESMKKEKPDLVLLDLVLPEEDGFDVLKSMKDDSQTRDVRVYVFSNLSQDDNRQKAHSLGAEGFIAKSEFTPQQVVGEVDKILSFGETQPEAVETTIDVGFSKKSLAESFPKQILMIEDEEVFLEVFGKKLEQEGYTIVTVQNGALGLKELVKQTYDLVILDVTMPNVNGLEVVQSQRSSGLNQQTPIIVLSNSIDDEDAHNIMASGANDFLVKTRITPSELVDKVRMLIG